MSTVAEALALGLPVYVRCADCQARSRVIPLSMLDRGLDLESAAAAGRFRCRLCGGRKSWVVPMLHSLLEERKRLRLECMPCGKDQVVSAAQACFMFGMATSFDDLRQGLACRKDCTLKVSAADPEEVISSSGAAVVNLPTEFR